jgi:hypothetical protein
MPLPANNEREEIHARHIEMRAFVRDDGLFDVDARLVDRKPFDFPRIEGSKAVPAGQPLHDLCVRLTIDSSLTVRAVKASSDVTPFSLCKEAEVSLEVIVGEQIAPGWSARIKSLLAGSVSCTHLMEMLIPMGTTALQGIRGLRRKGLDRLVASDFSPRVDSCYAYSHDRAVIRTYWPEHYDPKSS